MFPRDESRVATSSRITAIRARLGQLTPQRVSALTGHAGLSSRAITSEKVNVPVG